MSSIRSSFDERSVMVACTWTRPCSIRSLRRTRTTPIGMETNAETSATERVSQTSSTWSAPALRSPVHRVEALLSTQGGLQRKVDRRLGATGRDRVRADEASRRSALAMSPAGVISVPRRLLTRQAPAVGATRAWAWTVRPTRSTSSAIS